jgi:plasmid stabilization system protein ParE
MGVVVHRLVARDLRGVLAYYRQEAGPELAERFYAAFLEAVAAVDRQPGRFHRVGQILRRANLSRFPYHLLFRESAGGVHVLVLRHHRRDPSFGMDRG